MLYAVEGDKYFSMHLATLVMCLLINAPCLLISEFEGGTWMQMAQFRKNESKKKEKQRSLLYIRCKRYFTGTA